MAASTHRAEIHVMVFECVDGVPSERLLTVPCAVIGVADDIARSQSEGKRIALVFQANALLVWYHDGREQFREFPANKFAAARLGIDDMQLCLVLPPETRMPAPVRVPMVEYLSFNLQ